MVRAFDIFSVSFRVAIVHTLSPLSIYARKGNAGDLQT